MTDADLVEPDTELSTGAAFLVSAIENARLSELQEAFDHLGWTLHFDAAERPRRPQKRVCLCGTTPDPGVCPTDHGKGLPAGGHCACVHAKERNDRSTPGSGGGGLMFPEQFGPFQFWAPDSDRGVTEWQVSDGGGWYPITLADRDACLFFAGAMTAGMTMVQVEQLRDQHNRAQPSVPITARHLIEALDPDSLQTECEDCGQKRAVDRDHTCDDEEQP